MAMTHLSNADGKVIERKWVMRWGAMLVALMLGLPVATASAQQLQYLSVNGDWKAYSFERDGKKVCYMASAPVKEEGDYSSRGQIYALVTNDPARSIDNQFSIVTGYTYKEDSTVSVEIGAREFTLFTENDRAWTQGPEDDSAAVQAMVRGKDMIVKGTSSRGTLTTDTYSLIGFTATKKAIDRACAN